MALGRVARGRLETILTPLADRLAAGGVTPDQLTLAGLLLTGLSVFFYWLGGAWLFAAAASLMAGGFLDMLDGALARRTGRLSRAGAFLDSVADRVSDTLVAVGYLLTGVVQPLLALLMLATSMLVSYSRARGESLGVRLADVGLGERGVRLLIVIVATLTAYIYPQALNISAAVLTVLAGFTVVERFLHTLEELGLS
ncbi:CDP-diacylglycerol--inositol 3-phosphatidyltransferase [archaeon HR01]|nr:CDP-diacylglycerol--inositol 3-phosphatidyltransferase [archaeon HR01]